jgi:hypothetical protein
MVLRTKSELKFQVDEAGFAAIGGCAGLGISLNRINNLCR